VRRCGHQDGFLPGIVRYGPFRVPGPSATGFYPDRSNAADTSVALLHSEADRDPYDRGLTDLVGDLSTRSEAFRTRRAAHDVRLHRTGVKHFKHPRRRPARPRLRERTDRITVPSA
jgi:hypothetical protein